MTEYLQTTLFYSIYWHLNSRSLPIFSRKLNYFESFCGIQNKLAAFSLI